MMLRWLVPVFRFLTAHNFVRIEQRGRSGPLQYVCRFGLSNIYLTLNIRYFVVSSYHDNNLKGFSRHYFLLMSLITEK